MFTVSNRNSTKRCEICLKLTIKTTEQYQWHCFSVFIVNFNNISHLVLVFLQLTLSMQMPAWSCVLLRILSKYITREYKNSTIDFNISNLEHFFPRISLFEHIFWRRYRSNKSNYLWAVSVAVHLIQRTQSNITALNTHFTVYVE